MRFVVLHISAGNDKVKIRSYLQFPQGDVRCPFVLAGEDGKPYLPLFQEAEHFLDAFMQ